MRLSAVPRRFLSVGTLLATIYATGVASGNDFGVAGTPVTPARPSYYNIPPKHPGAAGVSAAATAVVPSAAVVPAVTGSSGGSAAPVYVTSGSEETRLAREIAAMRSDLRTVQEENQKLAFRMEALERDNETKDAQLKELQSLLSVLDGQVSAADKQWLERMENLKRNMDSERELRRKQLESLSSNLAHELTKVQQRPAAAPAAVLPAGKFKEFSVQKGDTLSTIAVSAGISVQALKDANGLKSDMIRVGQVLRVPVK